MQEFKKKSESSSQNSSTLMDINQLRNKFNDGTK